MTDSFLPIAQTAKHLDKVQTVFEVTPGSPPTYKAEFTFHVLNEENRVLNVHNGNLTPHATGWTLTAAQKTALGACTNVAQAQKILLDIYLTKAEGALG